MTEDNVYKIFQLTDIFINKYSYTQIVIKQFKLYNSKEVWLFNANNPNYQIIRITLSSSKTFIYEKHIDTYLDFIKKSIKNDDAKFLDIHISVEDYDKDNENYDYINIDEKYYSGVDIKNIYPEILNSIHRVEDSNTEIKNIIEKIQKNINDRLKNRPFFVKHPYIVTYIIIILCIINYLLGLYFKSKYSDTSAVYVLLGAEYKTFTLGLKQVYRLITYGFVHSDIIHLACNMISLYSIGRLIENRYGHLKYLLIILFSILVGGLTQGILSDNTICIGLSGGIYGLLVVFIIEVISNGYISVTSLMPTIFINIGLNFMSNTAWMCHLGGAIGGFTIYFLLKDNKNIARISLCIFMLLCLIYKYFSIDKIESIYAGTDFNVIQIINDLKFKSYAEKLFNKLLYFYSKIGG